MHITPADHHPSDGPRVGDFYVNRATGVLVEVMEVDHTGDVMVLDVTAPLDGEWQQLTLAQISSSFWVRVSDYAAAA